MAAEPAVTSLDPRRARLAVLVPCYNEALTIAEVVRQFRAELPDAEVLVFDNGSTDGTAEAARAAGARVVFVPRRGKGHVVQSMFRSVDADVYVMVDGDGTYPAAAVHDLVAPVRRGEADMVIGSRLHGASHSAFRPLNRFGNRLFRELLHALFGVRLTDLLSGYRAFSRRLVRGLPLFGGGFETETEMTIKAVHRGFRLIEVPVDLGLRPPGSRSKIRVLQDGLLILNTMLALCRDYKPLTFFGGLGLLLFATALGPGIYGLVAFVRTGSSSGLAWALGGALMLLAAGLALLAGFVLHSVARHFQELDLHLQVMADDLRDDAGRGEDRRGGHGPGA